MGEACVVVVNNVPDDAEPYIIARFNDGKLWYWGSWDKEDVAIDIAEQVNGLVVERVINKPLPFK